MITRFTDPHESYFDTQIRTLTKSKLTETIVISFLITLLLVFVLSWNTFTLYRGFKQTVDRDFRLEQLSARTTYLDEVLTMSAYMAAQSGDLKWVERYQSYEPELTEVIDELIKIDPTIEVDFNQTKIANDRLVEYETRSFELLRQGKKQEAEKLLFGPDYARQKQIYAQGVERTLARIRANVERQIQLYQRNLWWSLVLAGISFPIIIVLWAIVLTTGKTYIRERERTQRKMLASQSSLQDLNASLELQTQTIEAQERITKEENENLQTDVSNLLDIVLAVENGDLTVQAPVSDRVTGLVADSFNRLLERLASIMAVVYSTSQQVTQSAENLEQLSLATSQQAQKQSQALGVVQRLIQDVNSLTENNTQQTVAANEAVKQAQSSVIQGQQQMKQLTEGIDTLQEGSEQIVKRVQNLNEFVQLAVQFAKDQKRIASMTRVLSLNASLLSARAIEQQDPQQFASIAREFETISNQVNDLAVQTSQSLILLQQRTDQIQTVVSGLNQDVEKIDRIVKDFTTGVGESRQILDKITTTTVQVDRAGQQVTQSSSAIAEAAQTTLKSIQEIAEIAADTETQANITRERSDAMEKLSRDLYEIVGFFRIAPETMQAVSAGKVLQAAGSKGTSSNGVRADLVNNASK
jgi:twitching motility protein PilJ